MCRSFKPHFGLSALRVACRKDLYRTCWLASALEQDTPCIPTYCHSSTPYDRFKQPHMETQPGVSLKLVSSQIRTTVCRPSSQALDCRSACGGTKLIPKPPSRQRTTLTFSSWATMSALRSLIPGSLMPRSRWYPERRNICMLAMIYERTTTRQNEQDGRGSSWIERLKTANRILGQYRASRICKNWHPISYDPFENFLALVLLLVQDSTNTQTRRTIWNQVEDPATNVGSSKTN